jgi:hypothetical protein
LRGHKYAVLVVMLLAALAVQSVGVGAGLGGVLADAVTTVLGVAIFVVVFQRARERAGMAAILFLVVLIGWGRHALGGRFDHAVSVAHQALMAIFSWVAVWVILRDLFRASAIGAENVRGAICGYLIAGSAWGHVNAFTYLLVPEAYSVAPQVDALLADWHGRGALFSYYSFAQLLTIGYSDLTPVRAPATTLSLFAALFGVFYTAVVVSQFVGMAQSRRRQGPNDK